MGDRGSISGGATTAPAPISDSGDVHYVHGGEYRLTAERNEVGNLDLYHAGSQVGWVSRQPITGLWHLTAWRRGRAFLTGDTADEVLADVIDTFGLRQRGDS